MKKTTQAKRETTKKNHQGAAPKLGVVLGALEKNVAPGALIAPSTCNRGRYCI